MLYEVITDADSSELAQSLFGLSEIRSMQGDFDQAESLLRQAIEIQRPTSDTESLELARSLDALALTYSDQARYDEAESLAGRLVSANEQVKAATGVDLSRALREKLEPPTPAPRR